MNDTQPQTRNCQTCGAPVADINGLLAHVGGGAVMQKCNHCGWKGSQVGNFVACPACGDATQLVNDHVAS